MVPLSLYLSLFLLRTRHAVAVLLLAFLCCPREAAFIVHRADQNRQGNVRLDIPSSQELRKASEARFRVLADRNDAGSFLDCISRFAYETLDTHHALRKRMAVIVKVCSNWRYTNPTPVLRASLIRTKLSSTEQRMRRSLISRRIFRLLKQAKKPVLQYINSRLSKVLAIVISDDDDFDPVKYVTCSGINGVRDLSFADLDVPRNQRKQGRKLLNLLRRADDDTFQKVCRKLYRRFNFNAPSQ